MNSQTTTRTAHEVFHRLVGGVTRLASEDLTEIERLVALYAEEPHIEHPLTPNDLPPLTSRAQLREHFTEAARRLQGIEELWVERVNVHDTADPEVIVVEFAYAGTGEDGAFERPCVFVMRVRGGEIVSARDYNGPRVPRTGRAG